MDLSSRLGTAYVAISYFESGSRHDAPLQNAQ